MTHKTVRREEYYLRAAAIFFILFSTSCSLPPTRAKAPVSRLPGGGASQTGIASWYGPGFHGKPTASGSIYNQHELTAAHQTLPLGTHVMVTNLENGKSTEVTINDRGPFAKGRIIDLSYAAARSLGMIGAGTAPVRIEVIDGPYEIQAIRQRLDYTLQAGSFTEIESAQRLRDQLAKSFPDITPISIVPLHAEDAIYYRVQLGTFSDRRDAEREARRLARKGLSMIIMEK